ncbi:hypothetical protein NE237_007967 [Protea cynaroides]|uniref:GDSL esterase/lipase n=1 Tax=Protea cynaroides TaxID=273540 RepID=A0A9Q0KQ37_9MAGN|nr:hypothetical protein NE237_007967 [Protea cynaroides]
MACRLLRLVVSSALLAVTSFPCLVLALTPTQSGSFGLPYLSAYLDSVGSNFTGGANFATAGSAINPPNPSGDNLFCLNAQFYEFIDFYQRSQEARIKGVVWQELMPKEDDFSRALNTFDIGQNDLTIGYFLNKSTDHVKAYVPDLMNQFTTVIKNIYWQGGRSFWIHNTGPVGCLPNLLDQLPITAAEVDRAVITSFPSLVLALTPTQCDFPAIFNFGDSNSDTGGLPAAYGQVLPPNGETYFHAPAGRHCDGRLLIDFIAGNFGLPYLSPYLDSVGTNFTGGANFASSGSTIRTPNTIGYSPFPLNVQFNELNDFHQRSQVTRRKGVVWQELMPKQDDFSRALYTFDIGQNDLTAGYFLNMSTDQVRAYVPDLINQFSTIIKNIYWQGGRSFWIHNTGPVGCLPYILDLLLITAAQVDKVGCASPFNEVAQYFNQRLKEAVAQLRKDLPLAAITYVDVYSVKYSLYRQASKQGFELPLVACCYGSINITRYGKQIPVSKSCKDPSVRINWDGVHYTEAANKWVYDRIVDGSYSDPPIPLKMACHRYAN